MPLCELRDLDTNGEFFLSYFFRGGREKEKTRAIARVCESHFRRRSDALTDHGVGTVAIV
jgi:hypothetical protein